MATRVAGEEEGEVSKGEVSKGEVGKGDGSGNKETTTRRQRDDVMTTRR